MHTPVGLRKEQLQSRNHFSYGLQALAVRNEQTEEKGDGGVEGQLRLTGIPRAINGKAKRHIETHSL